MRHLKTSLSDVWTVMQSYHLLLVYVAVVVTAILALTIFGD
ncbi:MAG: hypothetical protein ABR616_05910 [Dermatophilaceae bacterium]